jgi:hypothetical protein
MAAWRTLGSLVVAFTVAGTGRAQTYTLIEKPQAGDCLQVHIEMALTGDMTVTKDKQRQTIKLKAMATHDFPERLLAAGANGIGQKVARVYEAARATIATGDERSERTLRADRNLIIAQRHPDLLVYAPAGPLTREELELTSEHFDTLALAGLLPPKPVALQETWKIGNDVAQALCSFEGLTEQNLTGKLEKVEGDAALVSVTGTASGIDLGALVKLTIQATCKVEMKAHRITALEWKQKDERGQGPASPASTVEATTVMKRTPISQPPCLSDVALISVPPGFDVPATMTQLTYHHDAATPFDVVYGRDWQMTGQTREHCILRLLDRGDFVAQATITPWEKARPGEHMTPAAFKEAMARTPGWQQGDVVQEGDIPSDNGRWYYRISAPGTMDGVKVVQNFFLIANPTGDQLVVAFTMTPAQAEKLGTRDLSLVQGIDFSTPR